MSLCPLKFFIRMDSMARKPEMECDREEGAWWDHETCCCAIRTIAISLCDMMVQGVSVQ